MKTLNTYIQENFLKTKYKSRYKYHPSTKEELKQLISDRIKKEGPECDLNDIDVSDITDMSKLFMETEFNGDISEWDMSNVTDTEEMFYECKNLTSLTIPNSVKSIGMRTFSDCTCLTSINIPNSVTSIEGYAFHCCSTLTSIFIPNSVTSIGDYAFLGCSSLSSITIPNSVTSMGLGTFRYCTSLTSITLQASIPPSVKYDTFYNINDCPIYVPADSVKKYKSAWSEYESRIKPIP